MRKRLPRRALDSLQLARTPAWSAGEFVWLAVVVTVVVVQQMAVAALGQRGVEADIRRTIVFVTTAAVIVLAFHFRRFVGAWLIAGGIVLNFIPMAAHGGLMPVAYEAVRGSGAFPEITEANIGGQVGKSKDIVLWREDVHFEPLSDRYVMTLPWYGTNIYSLGDFVIFAGIGFAVVQLTLYVVRGAPTRPPGPVGESGVTS